MRIARSHRIEDFASFDITDAEVIIKFIAAIILKEDVRSIRVESLVIFKNSLKTANQSLGLIFKGRVFAEPVVEAEAIRRVLKNFNEVSFDKICD
jgi:hypothetical protein